MFKSAANLLVLGLFVLGNMLPRDVNATREGAKSGCEPQAFSKVWNFKLGPKAVNSGLPGSADHPPFITALDENDYAIIVAALFGENNDLDTADHPDPYKEIDIINFDGVKQNDGTYRYVPEWCSKGGKK